MNKEAIEKVLAMLERQKFADWYNDGGRFDQWITGDCPFNSITKADILNDLAKLLGYPEFEWKA
jgi:hypothetical protein